MGKDNKKKEKEFSKMNRAELLEILITQVKENKALKETGELREKENEELSNKLTEAETKLKEKEINLEEAGSIAEASLKLNGLFTDAQNAAQQYLDNIKLLEAKKETAYKEIVGKAVTEADRIIREADEKAQLKEFEARRNASLITSRAEKECEQKKKEIDKYWDDLTKRLENFYESHQGLKALIQSSPK